MNTSLPPPTHLSSFYTPEVRLIEHATRNGISWFDIMYPRNSDALARELKVGKYAAGARQWTEVARSSGGGKRRKTD